MLKLKKMYKIFINTDNTSHRSTAYSLTEVVVPKLAHLNHENIFTEKQKKFLYFSIVYIDI